MTVSKQIENRIHGHDPGWVFSPADFLDLGSPHTVGMALIRMVREGQVRRLARGLYDFPRKHEQQGLLSPTVDMIAEALARRDGVRLQPSEAAAANMLHLSDQVPMRVVYETDGPPRKIKVGTLTIQFQRRAPRKMATAGKMSGLVFAALRGLGKRYVTLDQVSHLRQLLTPEDRQRLLQDLPQAPAWMHPFLRYIAKDEVHEMARKIAVIGTEIRILTIDQEDFISLTDMLKAKDGDFFISDWLRNRNTVEFLGIWERVHNPDFNYGEFAAIRSQAGLNSYKISVKEWVEKTNAIGLRATAGRYGGTYAHKDIAFEFGMWISAEFKIYLIKEFQRLKDIEQQQLGWDLKRDLAKINYRIPTDAIKENLIPSELMRQQTSLVYASEADVLNVALFGQTAKQWRDANPERKGNIRDYANVSQLVCLANLENLNALFINEGMVQAERLQKLNRIAIQQMKLLTDDPRVSLLGVNCDLTDRLIE